MWKVNTVANCPVTRGSQGVVRVPGWVIGEIAGAVGDENEWALIFKGRREMGGLVTVIEDFIVPDWQERRGTQVKLAPRVMGDEFIGVAHLHPKHIGPEFSHTDETEYNTRFAFSIVVSPQVKTDLERHLGFSYSAVCRFQLPCGDLGVAQVKLVPEGHGEGSPFWAEAKLASHGDAKKGLGDCSHYSVEHKDALGLQAEWQARCGLVPFGESGPVFRAFGSGDGRIEKELPKAALEMSRIGGYRRDGQGGVIYYPEPHAPKEVGEGYWENWYREAKRAEEERDWEDREIRDLYDEMDMRAAELEMREEEIAERERLLLKGV